MDKIYRVMLLAYPSDFRREYSGEMTLAFRDRGRDVVESNGAVALGPFVFHTLRDWAATVTRERHDAKSCT
jgi:hypothetical protein